MAPGQVGRDAHLLQRGHRPRPGRPAGHPVHGPDGRGELIGDRVHGGERRECVLGYEGEPAAPEGGAYGTGGAHQFLWSAFLWPGFRWSGFLWFEPYAARHRRPPWWHAEQRPGRQGLARARLAYHGQDLTGVYIEGEAADGFDGTEGDPQVPYGEQYFRTGVQRAGSLRGRRSAAGTKARRARTGGPPRAGPPAVYEAADTESPASSASATAGARAAQGARST